MYDPMVINRLDADGVPLEGIERKLAHHFLGRGNPIAKQILYALLGGSRRNAELMPLAKASPNNLTQGLARLKDEGLIVNVVDRSAPPGQVSYQLTTFGLVVVDWMRRYEFLDEIPFHRTQLADLA
jgi:DNA-binding HxlR family transcriptional regulator